MLPGEQHHRQTDFHHFGVPCVSSKQLLVKFVPQVYSKLLTLAVHRSMTRHEYRLNSTKVALRKPLLSSLSSFSLIWACIPQWKDLMSLIIDSGTPSLRHTHSASRGTDFFRSINTKNGFARCSQQAVARQISYLNIHVLS